MNGVTDAALDHASMAEELLTQAARYIEQEAFPSADRAIAAAQVHATLACAPSSLPASYYLGEVTATIDETDAAKVTVGSRVVFLTPPGSRSSGRYVNGQRVRFMGSDAFGTVREFGTDTSRAGGEDHEGEALVDFDDIGDQWVKAEQLRVVLGA